MRSTVNRWECDHRGEYDPQFLLFRIEEANRHFCLMAELNDSLVGRRLERHIQFLQPMTASTEFKINSAVCFDGPHMVTVIHQIRRVCDCTPIAAAIDGYAPRTFVAKEFRRRFETISIDMPNNCPPPLLGIAPGNLTASPKLIDRRRLTVTGRSMVRHQDTNVGNQAGDEFVASCVSNSMSAIWQLTTMTSDWLRDRDLRRTVTELRLAWISPLKAGDMIVMMSALIGASDTAFLLRHHFYEAKTMRPVVVCDMAAQPTDRTGRPIELEDGVRRHIRQSLMNEYLPA